MKRKYVQEQDQILSIKRNKIEIDVFQKVLLNETGSMIPESQTLQKTPTMTLSKICQTFRLCVFKSGGVKRKASIKIDYVNAIIEYMNSLTSINRESVMELEDKVTQGDNGRGQSKYLNASIPVRLFKNPQDYTTNHTEERSFSYDPQVGINLDDLRHFFNQENLQVIHPKSYKPALLFNGVLNTSLIPVMLGTQGYLRVSAARDTM